jgi:hypothetical protein
MRVWNGDQPNRSRRAGIVDRIGTVSAAVSLTPRPPRDAGDLEQLDARQRLVSNWTPRLGTGHQPIRMIRAIRMMRVRGFSFCVTDNDVRRRIR